jgi:hypothetical protein
MTEAIQVEGLINMLIEPRYAEKLAAIEGIIIESPAIG